MVRVRIHGRGGQGVVTTAELLSMAAFSDGKQAQAFPSFGSERMGAPVTAFYRIDERTIRTREAVTHPNIVIVQDPTLLYQVELFAGVAAGGATSSSIRPSRWIHEGSENFSSRCRAVIRAAASVQKNALRRDRPGQRAEIETGE